jgi:hypothetical protein
MVSIMEQEQNLRSTTTGLLCLLEQMLFLSMMKAHLLARQQKSQLNTGLAGSDNFYKGKMTNGDE